MKLIYQMTYPNKKLSINVKKCIAKIEEQYKSFIYTVYIVINRIYFLVIVSQTFFNFSICKSFIVFMRFL